MGAALGFGLFTNLLSYIPLLGAFIMPFFAAISATIYAERVRMEVLGKPNEGNREETMKS